MEMSIASILEQLIFLLSNYLDNKSYDHKNMKEHDIYLEKQLFIKAFC